MSDIGIGLLYLGEGDCALTGVESDRGRAKQYALEDLLLTLYKLSILEDEDFLKE